MWKSAVLLLLLGFGAALKLPSYIKPCARNDPKLNECALRSAKAALPSIINGDPKFKIPVIDPLKITEIRVEEQGVVGMKIVLSDVEIIGLGEVEIRGLNFELDKKLIHAEFFTPLLQIIGNYNMSGRVLVLPITGHGPANITLENVPLTYNLNYTLQKKKDGGKQHIVITGNSVTFDTTQAHFRFQNLFNGDKLLSENMGKFVRENWRDVIQDLGPSFANAIGEAIGSVIANLALSVPYEDVFPEKL